MERRSGPYRLGERYVLQYPGGVERLAEVDHLPGERGQPGLRPLPFEEPLPPHPLAGGEWRVEPGERLVRDWGGCFWSVTASAPRPEDRLAGGVAIACQVHFTRRTPAGERITYRAGSLWRPDALDDAALLRLLRGAWLMLETDPQERLRRSCAPPGVAVEL